MSTKYIKITGTPVYVKVSDGATSAGAPDKALTVSQAEVASPNVQPSDPSVDVLVNVTGLPSHNVPTDEPLFKYASDEFVIVTNLTVHMMKVFADTVTSHDAISSKTVAKGEVELVESTDDFDGLATIDDDQYATVAKVIADMTFQADVMAIEASKSLTESPVAASDALSLNIDPQIVDVVGGFVELLAINIDKDINESAQLTEAISIDFELAPFFETQLVADNVLIAAGKSDNDFVGYSDSFTLEPNVGVHESLSLVDSPVLFAISKGHHETLVNNELYSIVTGKVTSDNADVSDAGSAVMQNYVNGEYFSEFYVGELRNF